MVDTHALLVTGQTPLQLVIPTKPTTLSNQHSWMADPPFTVMDLGEGPGGPGTPLFLDQTEAERVEKYFLETGSPSLSQGLDDQPPPLISRSGFGTALCGDPRLF